MAQTKFSSDIEKKDEGYVKGIKRLMLKNEIPNQKILSQKLKVAESTVSSWLNGKIEPSLRNIVDMAEYFNVSIDYVCGKSNCPKPNDEQIHKAIGLSDESIKALKLIQSKKDNSDEKHLISILDFLIETTDKSPILINMYKYLLDDYWFVKKNSASNKDTFYPSTEYISKESETRSLLFDFQINQVYFQEVQNDLVRLKDKINEDKRNNLIKNNEKQKIRDRKNFEKQILEFNNSRKEEEQE